MADMELTLKCDDLKRSLDDNESRLKTLEENEISSKSITSIALNFQNMSEKLSSEIMEIREKSNFDIKGILENLVSSSNEFKNFSESLTKLDVEEKFKELGDIATSAINKDFLDYKQQLDALSSETKKKIDLLITEMSDSIQNEVNSFSEIVKNENESTLSNIGSIQNKLNEDLENFDNQLQDLKNLIINEIRNNIDGLKESVNTELCRNIEALRHSMNDEFRRNINEAKIRIIEENKSNLDKELENKLSKYFSVTKIFIIIIFCINLFLIGLLAYSIFVNK